ncbi:uncharacterized protein LOC101741934 isoform X2 [Bombyx mori]|uniref:uncharacterized protein LOC101741934 isoform X2 n=1 Tax=Bombyx mori TaxID=7091 RepID=UPI002ED3CCAC
MRVCVKYMMEATVRDSRTKANTKSKYSWLISRKPNTYLQGSQSLDKITPILQKLTPESCAMIAVKIDRLTKEPTHQTFAAFEKFVTEQYNIQMLSESIGRAKETKKKTSNKIHPYSGRERETEISYVTW